MLDYMLHLNCMDVGTAFAMNISSHKILITACTVLFTLHC